MANPRAHLILFSRREPSYLRSVLGAAARRPQCTPYAQTRLQSSTPTRQPQRPPPHQADLLNIPEKRASTSAYRPFVRPFAKVFLGAMFTYQVLYWCWEKLRLDEIKEEKLAEIAVLEAQVEDYKARKAAGLLANGTSRTEGATNAGSSLFSTIRSWF